MNVYRVRTHAPLPSVDDPAFFPTADLTERLFPTPEILVFPRDRILHEGLRRTNAFELPDDADKILRKLWWRDAFSGPPARCARAGARTHYVGIVHHNTTTDGLLGVGRVAGRQPDELWFQMAPGTLIPAGWPILQVQGVLAHELGHNYRRRHIDCPVGSPAGIDRSYPYITPDPCRIDDRPLTAPETYFGFDTLSIQPIIPTATADIMSYGSVEWISDYTWQAIFDGVPGSTLRMEAAALASEGRASQTTELVALAGTIITGTNEGELDYGWIISDATGDVSEEVAEFEGSATAGYHIQLIGANGEVLEDREVEFLETAEPQGASRAFGLLIPAPETPVAEVRLLAGEIVIDRLQPGMASPTLEVLAPAGGEVASDEVNLRWRATDPDGDPLRFTVQYSPDQGEHWLALVENEAILAETDTFSLVLDLQGVPGSNGPNALLRVLASDGYNTAYALSAPFTVLDHAPEPYIVAPQPEMWFDAGSVALLRGGATDAEDGAVADGDLRWQVDGEDVGTGRELVVGGLAPGSFTVSLTARDSAGQEATAQTTLNVTPLSIPAANSQPLSPVLDGLCDDDAYHSSAVVQLRPYADGSQATVQLLRTDTHLWVCFSGLQREGAITGAAAGIRVDTDNSRDPFAGSNDYAFFVIEDGTPLVQAGNGSGGYSSYPEGLAARVSATETAWHAELQISATVLNGWGHWAAVQLGHYWVGYHGDGHTWPYTTIWNEPATWAETALGTLPEITALTPISTTAGSNTFMLTLDGRNFEEGSTVLWNGDPLPTTYVSASKVRANVPSSTLTAAGIVSITVQNPSAFAAPVRTFVVNNPIPEITSLSPASVEPHAPPFTLTVNGAGFVPGATVLWDGEPYATTFINDAQLSVTVDVGSVAFAEEPVGVTVLNPDPTEQVSNTVLFVIDQGLDNQRPNFLPLIMN